MIKIKLGADPEFFLKKGNQNVSAHGLVPGTKREPYVLSSGAVQLDGTAVEFNIPPANSASEFSASIDAVLRELRNLIPSAYSFNYSPTVTYSKNYFDKEIPEDAKVLGCDPDFNAYNNGEANPTPKPIDCMRTGAGHLHIGWGDSFDTTHPSHLWDCCTLTKNLDQFFKHYESIWDKDNTRRQMYGKPGAFRPKKYGLEYRVLSNAWLNYPKMWPWLYEATQFVFDQTCKGNFINIYTCYYSRIEDKIEGINRTMEHTYGKAPVFKMDFLNG